MKKESNPKPTYKKPLPPPSPPKKKSNMRHHDVICSNNICDYCSYDWSKGNCGKACENGSDFVGRKVKLI